MWDKIVSQETLQLCSEHFFLKYMMEQFCFEPFIHSEHPFFLKLYTVNYYEFKQLSFGELNDTDLWTRPY